MKNGDLGCETSTNRQWRTYAANMLSRPLRWGTRLLYGRRTTVVYGGGVKVVYGGSDSK